MLIIISNATLWNMFNGRMQGKAYFITKRKQMAENLEKKFMEKAFEGYLLKMWIIYFENII